MATILVIDDEKNTRKMVRLALTQAGHEVETADTGVQGLNLFGNGTAWNLTLIDQRMPGLEGREVVREVRRRDPAARIVMMSAFATSELATEVLQSGALDFLRKPFLTNVLRGAVTATLARPRQVIPMPEESPPERQSEAGETTEEKQDKAKQAQYNPAESSHGQVSRSRAYLSGISYRANGFSFCPLDSPEGTRAVQARMPSLTIGHVYRVQQPNGESSQCFVGITPHIRDQVQQQTSSYLPQDSPAWEEICGQALLNFMWEKAKTPPDVLTIYEVPTSWRDHHRSPAPWGPYTWGLYTRGESQETRR